MVLSYIKFSMLFMVLKLIWLLFYEEKMKNKVSKTTKNINVAKRFVLEISNFARTLNSIKKAKDHIQLWATRKYLNQAK